MKKTLTWSFVLFAAAMVLMTVACGGGDDAEPVAEPVASAPPAPAGNATISGTVNASGAEDGDVAIKMDADPVCAGLHEGGVESQTVATDADGNLANAFVYVKSGLTGSYSAPAEAAILSQAAEERSPGRPGTQLSSEAEERPDFGGGYQPADLQTEREEKVPHEKRATARTNEPALYLIDANPGRVGEGCRHPPRLAGVVPG